MENEHDNATTPNPYRTEKDTNDKPKISSRGGPRPGSGRKPGSKNKINKATVQTVLEKLYDKTGQVYEDILLEDFIRARASNEQLAFKYHTLLTAKLMPDLSKVEVVDGESEREEKELAFREALESLLKQSDQDTPLH